MKRTLNANAEDLGLASTVRDAAHSGAPDRYVSALLAPRPVREDLVAIAAYSAEIERVLQHVSDPRIGEIRLQWWRDALSAGSRGERSGHPVADAVSTAIQRHALPLALFDDHLDAVAHSFYADPPADDEQLSLALQMTEGTLFTLAAHILGAKEFDASRGIGRDAALAYGLAKLGLSLPYALAHGHVPLPPSLAPEGNIPDWRGSMEKLCDRSRLHLKHVRSAYAAEPEAVKTALLPVALVEPYLRVLTRGSHDFARDITDIAPLRRTWRLVTTHIRGRI